MLVLSAHFIVLRLQLQYILISFLLCSSVLLLYSNEVLMLLSESAHCRSLIFTGVLEPLYATLHLAIFSACVVIYPYGIYSVWLFMIPGLFQYEKSYLGTILCSYILICCVALLSAWLVLPHIVAYFTLVDIESPHFVLSFEGRVEEFVRLVMMLFKHALFVVHICIVIFIYICSDLRRMRFLIHRRYVIYLCIVVIFSLLTPPTLTSLLIVVIPSVAIIEAILFAGITYHTLMSC